MNESYKNQNLFLLHINTNLGEGHNYNVGIEKCLNDGCDLITLFPDDVTINENKFRPDKIIKFFYENCNIKTDLLSWLYNKKSLKLYNKNLLNKYGVVDTGMTFSKDLVKKLRFREDFLMDQQDLYFCNQVIKNGGRILIYPELTISVLPIGREITTGIPHLPLWRLYLHGRNSITIVWKRKNIYLIFILNTLLFFNFLFF